MENFIRRTSEMFEMFQYTLIIAILILCFIPLRIPLFFYLLMPLLATVGFFIYKEVCENRIKLFIIYRIVLLAFMFSIPNYVFKALFEKFDKNVPVLVSISFGMFCFICGTFLLFVDNKKKQEKVLNINIMKTLTQKQTISEEISDYSVVLCKNKETGKDVILDEDARYTHLLVIGPTGCGKTSQSLIPMILQDIRKKHSVIVIEPKGDLAEKVYAMGVYYGEEVIYFNPTLPDCPSFNPLADKEDKVIETLTTIFNMLSPDSATYFQDISDNLIRKSVMVLKRIEEAYRDPNTGISSRPSTMIDLSDILHNTENRGREYMNDLLSIPCLTAEEEKQNKDTVDWFLNEYYSDRSKVYENSSGLRTQVSKLIQNKYVRRVLNPANGISDISFDDILAQGKSIAISTAQGDLRELGSYLGYFIIFSLQSAIFRRPGNERTRKPSFLYIDEFQKYCSPQQADLLTQARSYKVGVTLATQGREQITMGAGRDGKAFLEVVSANARSVIAFPGISQQDARYFSLSFGDETRIQERTGETRQKFSIAYGFRDMNYPTSSKQYMEVTEEKYSESELIYKPFSEITYRIIQNKSVQKAQNGVASWIPKDINNALDIIVEEYNENQQKKKAEAEYKEKIERQKIYDDFQRGMNGGGRTLGDVTKQKKVPTQIKSEQKATAGKRDFKQPVEESGISFGSEIGLTEDDLRRRERKDNKFSDFHDNNDEKREKQNKDCPYDDEAINSQNEQFNHFNDDDGNFFGDY